MCVRACVRALHACDRCVHACMRALRVRACVSCVRACQESRPSRSRRLLDFFFDLLHSGQSSTSSSAIGAYRRLSQHEPLRAETGGLRARADTEQTHPTRNLPPGNLPPTREMKARFFFCCVSAKQMRDIGVWVAVLQITSTFARADVICSNIPVLVLRQHDKLSSIQMFGSESDRSRSLSWIFRSISIIAKNPHVKYISSDQRN